MLALKVSVEADQEDQDCCSESASTVLSAPKHLHIPRKVAPRGFPTALSRSAERGPVVWVALDVWPDVAVLSRKSWVMATPMLAKERDVRSQARNVRSAARQLRAASSCEALNPT